MIIGAPMASFTVDAVTRKVRVLSPSIVYHRECVEQCNDVTFIFAIEGMKNVD